MSDTPPITIGVTCYNAADTIGRAVESALKQDWENFEVLVVDDSSSDHSWEVLGELASRDERIRIMRHATNTGVAAARNTILGHAHGEFVAYFDDDDISLPERLRAQYQRIIAYEQKIGAELIFCYSDRRVVTGRGIATNHIGAGIGRESPEPYGPVVADYLLGVGRDQRFVWGMSGSCTMMARKKAYLTVGSFDPRFRRCGEIDLAIQAALLGGHFIAVDRPLVTQYKTKTEDKAGEIPLKYALFLREKYRDYLEDRRLYRASRLLAYSNFYGNKKHIWKSRAYRLLAFAFSPSLLMSRIQSRLRSEPALVAI